MAAHDQMTVVNAAATLLTSLLDATGDNASVEETHLRKSFAKDHRMNLLVPGSTVYFEYMLKLEGMEDLWAEYRACSKRRYPLAAYRREVKEAIIDFMQQCPSHGKLKGMMDEYNVDAAKYRVPQKYSGHVGKYLLSVDLKKANFQAMKEIDPRFVNDAPDYETFVRGFTEEETLIKSKYFRQVIFGMVNPRLQQKVEMTLMHRVLDHVLEHKRCPVAADALICKTADEVVFLLSDDREAALAETGAVRDILASLPLQLHVNVFVMHPLGKGPMRVRENAESGEREAWAVPARLKPQALKHVRGEALVEMDMWYSEDNQLCRYMRPYDFTP